LMQLAWLGQQVGVDLWNFRTADGRCIQTALNFLLPFAEGKVPWTYQEISGFHGDALLHSVERAERAYHDPAYAAAVGQLSAGRSDLEAVLLRGN